MKTKSSVVYARDVEGLAKELAGMASEGYQPVSITASASGFVAITSLPQMQTVMDFYFLLWKLFAALILFGAPFALIILLLMNAK